MLRPFLLTLTAVVCALLLANCGTIMHGTTQEISISSSPSNALVTVNRQLTGRTPVVFDLSRKNRHLVQIELDGYEPYELTMTRSVSGWVVGNILFGGLIGLAVDAISGGLYKLSPEMINAEMRSAGTSVNMKDGSVYVVVVLEPSPDWERIGQLIELP